MPGKLEPEILRRVKEETSITDVVTDYLSLRKSGRNLLAVCPFHQEKTPSFTVNEEKGIFHCFGCQAGGDVISFVMKIEGLQFFEAVAFLARRAGIPISFSEADRKKEDRGKKILRLNLAAALFCHRWLKENGRGAETTRKYLARRGIEPGTAEFFRLGCAPDRFTLEKALSAEGFTREETANAGLRFHGRLVFPIFNLSGECAGFGARALDDSQPKYLNTAENEVFHKGRILYGLNTSRQSVREKDRLILVEGYLDLIKVFQAGLTNAAAGLGTALTREQAGLIKRFTRNVVLLYDADDAGRRAAERNIEPLFAADLEVTVASLPEGHDPDSFVDEHGPEALRELVDKGRDAIDFKLEQVLARSRSGVPGAKIGAAREIIPLLAALPTPLRRSHYLALAAQKLDLPEQGLREEFQARRRPGPVTRPESAPVRAGEPPHRGACLAEQIILGCALNCPETRRVALEKIDLSELMVPEHADVCRLLSRMDDSDNIDQARVMEPEKIELLEKLCRLAEENEPGGNRKTGNLENYLRTISDFHLRKKIRAQMAENDARDGRDPDLERLARLQKMIMSRHPGRGNGRDG